MKQFLRNLCDRMVMFILLGATTRFAQSTIFGDAPQRASCFAEIFTSPECGVTILAISMIHIAIYIELRYAVPIYSLYHR